MVKPTRHHQRPRLIQELRQGGQSGLSGNGRLYSEDGGANTNYTLRCIKKSSCALSSLKSGWEPKQTWMSLEPLEPQVAVRRLSQAVGLDLLQRFLELRVFLFVFRIHLRRRCGKPQVFVAPNCHVWRKTAMGSKENQIRSKQIRKIEETLKIFNVFGIHFGVSYSNVFSSYKLEVSCFFPPKSSILDWDYPV